MDLVSGIAAATQAINIAKSLRTIEKNYDAAAYRAQLADLLNSLTDTKLALSEAKDCLAEREKEILRLKESFETKAKLVRGKGDYDFPSDENGKPIGYPVCPRCAQLEGRVIQLKEHERSGTAKCPACRDVFNPVVCYLPSGSGHETKQDKESADWDAAMSRSPGVSFY